MNTFIQIYSIIRNKLRKKVELILMRKKWRKENSHNKMSPVNYFPMGLVKVGKYSYGPLNIKYWGTEGEGLEIGNFVSIAEGVKFVLGGNHEVDTFTTFPFKVMVLGQKIEAWTKGKIVVKDDVWIGMDSMILSGVTIGQGAIVAAGSVVTKDVPPYAIVGGNPAKVIKYRFSQELVEEMIKFDWSKVDISKIKDVEKELYEKLNTSNMEAIKKQLIK